MQGRGPCSALVSSGKNGYCTGSLQPNFSHTYMCARNVFPLISGGKVALNHGSGLRRFNATFPPDIKGKSLGVSDATFEVKMWQPKLGYQLCS